jgi:hypothetical protein
MNEEMVETIWPYFETEKFDDGDDDDDHHHHHHHHHVGVVSVKKTRFKLY